MAEFSHLLDDLAEQFATSIARSVDAIDQEIMTLDDAAAYLTKQKNLLPGVKDSVISISEEQDVRYGSSSHKLVFIQLLLDGQGQPMVSGARTYYGRTLYIKDVDEEMKRFLNGCSTKILRG